MLEVHFARRHAFERWRTLIDEIVIAQDQIAGNTSAVEVVYPDAGNSRNR